MNLRYEGPMFGWGQEKVDLVPTEEQLRREEAAKHLAQINFQIKRLKRSTYPSLPEVKELQALEERKRQLLQSWWDYTRNG